MYIISIYVKNTETGNEDFGIIGSDFLPTDEQDYSATVFETKEETIAYLKSASYEATGSYGNDWKFKDKTSSGVESRCRIWKVGEQRKKENNMFKALKTIKKIKQLQKEMHDASVAFLLMQDLGLFPDSEKGRARAKSFHDVSHIIKDVLDGKSVDEAMTRLEIKVKDEEVYAHV